MSGRGSTRGVFNGFSLLMFCSRARNDAATGEVPAAPFEGGGRVAFGGASLLMLASAILFSSPTSPFAAGAAAMLFG